MDVQLHAVQAELGDCFILDFLDEHGNREYWLVDGGPGNRVMADSFRKAANCLFGAMNTIGGGIPRLQRLIITHNDFDHTYGTAALLNTLKDPDIAEKGGRDDLKYVSWANGYKSLNKRNPKQWPIDHIWFNDKANILRAQNKFLTYGWMDNLMDRPTTGFRQAYSAKLGSNSLPFVNDDGLPTKNDGKLISRALSDAADFHNIERIHAPSGAQLDDVLKKLNTRAPPAWTGTATNYRDARHRKISEFPSSGDTWRRIEVKNPGDDNSKTNASSIMFTFTHTAGQETRRILMTGDSTGDILNKSFENVTHPNLVWDIIKLMHHGSSNNCILSADLEYQQSIELYFRTFQATKYVISSDTFTGGEPNADLWTLKGIADAFATDPTHRRLYLTNGCSYTSWEALLFHSGSRKWEGAPPLEIWALLKADVCDYGTVVPGLDTRGETGWTRLDTDNNFAAYFGSRIAHYFNQVRQDANGRDIVPIWRSARGNDDTEKAESILPKLRNLNSATSPVGKIISKRKLKWAAAPAESTWMGITRSAIDVVIDASGLFTASRRLAQAAVRHLPITPPLMQKTPLTWHDIMVANLMGVSDLTADDLSDLSMPNIVTKDQVLIDGRTAHWVDLPTYMSLMQSSNETYTATATRPALTPDYFATTSYWFLNAADPTKVQAPILAWMLLSLLIDAKIATELMTAFPLNANGPSSAGFNPFMAGTSVTTAVDGSLGLWSMLVQNFRASVIVPATAGAALIVRCFYFELAPPPPELNSIASKDFLTWTVPFSNGLWSTGQVQFEHRNNLRVKMLWPLLQDSLTFCNFQGDLTISRGPPAPPPTAMAVHGRMYLQRGDAASYDIQLDDNVGALDILRILSPTAETAENILGSIATRISVPDLDLSKSINENLKMKNAGIILRQHQPLFVSVSVDDFYGTIITSEVLQLAGDLLPGTKGLKIPTNLPDLTLMIHHATGGGEKVSVAFSQAVGGIGTVALEVGPSPDDQTKFDVWTICNHGVSVNDILVKLEAATLLPQFQSASMFTESLLNDFTVPYTHMTFGPTSRYTKGSYSIQQLTLVIEVEPIKLPSDSPIITLRDLTLEIMYSYPEAKFAGSKGDLSVCGNSTVELGGFDAICTFYFSKAAEAIEVDLAEDDNADDSTAAADLAASHSDLTNDFASYVDLKFRFQNQSPSVGDIVHAILNEPLDAAGLNLNSLTTNIPSDIRDVLESVDFQEIDMRLQKNVSSNNKWQVVFFHIQVRLDGFEDVLNLLKPVGITFATPMLDITMHYPSDATKKAYEVSLNSWFACGKGRCKISANFNSPPPGLVSNPESFSLSLVADAGHPGLPIGTIVEKFAETTASALKLNIGARVPDKVKDVLESITIDETMFTMVKVKDQWEMKLVEVTVTSQAESLNPFGNFQISNVQLHFARDSGKDTGNPPETTVQFNTDLLVGTDLNIRAGFTYDTVAGWSMSFNSSTSINLVDLILKGLQGIGLSIPEDVKHEIDDILQIDIESFYIAYSNQDDKENITFSNDSGPNGAVSLFGVGVSNISVICNKSGGVWSSYTVSLSLPTPFEPLANFCKIPLLDGVKVVNGKFALIKGTPAKNVVGDAKVPASSSTEITLCGKIELGGSDFMNLIHSIIQVDSVDIAILGGGEVTVGIAKARIGQDFLGVFEIMDCFLNFQLLGFGLGATLKITASWLSKNPIEPTFTLIVMDDGAFGGSVEIALINEPFGIPGLILTDLHFSLVWLAEAEEPQSLSAGATVSLKEKGSEDISASFDASVDELNDANNWFKMHIVNMYLPNMIRAMTNGSLPSPFDSKMLLVGYRELYIDLEPKANKFAFKADFFVAALEGKAQASIDMTSGIKFAGTMTRVNILGLVQIHGYQDANADPFVFLDTTVALNDIVPVKPDTDPNWLGATLSNQHDLEGTVFALSASLIFLGTQWDGYGLINEQELQLVVKAPSSIDAPSVSIKMSENFTVAINETKFVAGTQFTIDFKLNLPNISVFGVSLGSYSGTVVSFSDDLKLSVTYSITDWHNDDLEFFAKVDVEDVLGLNIKEQLDLDVSIANVSQLPNAIESFIEDKVIDYLEDKLNPTRFINDAINSLVNDFNVVGSDIMAALSEAGHAIEAIAAAVKDVLNMGIDEVASGLLDLGHDVNEVGQVLGSVFNAAPQEIVSGLTSAGVAVEHAVDAAFGELGAALSDKFGLVGSSVVSVATSAVDAVKEFGSDVGDFADSSISDVGNFCEGVADGLGKLVSGGDCEIM